MARKSKSKGQVMSVKNSSLEYAPSMITLYNNEIKSGLKEMYNYSNVMEIPRLRSISINMGIGDAKNNAKELESAVDELKSITGQKPVITRAKKDISNFKLRKGISYLTEFFRCIPIGSFGNGFHPECLFKKMIGFLDSVLKPGPASNVALSSEISM